MSDADRYRSRPHCTHVLVVMNPFDVLVLVIKEGKVVKATAPDYVGMDETAARSGATSVMRYELDIQDGQGAGGYPREVEVIL